MRFTCLNLFRCSGGVSVTISKPSKVSHCIAGSKMLLLIQVLFDTGYGGYPASLSVGRIYVKSFKSFFFCCRISGYRKKQTVKSYRCS